MNTDAVLRILICALGLTLILSANVFKLPDMTADGAVFFKVP